MSVLITTDFGSMSYDGGSRQPMSLPVQLICLPLEMHHGPSPSRPLPADLAHLESESLSSVLRMCHCGGSL